LPFLTLDEARMTELYFRLHFIICKHKRISDVYNVLKVPLLKIFLKQTYKRNQSIREYNS